MKVVKLVVGALFVLSFVIADVSANTEVPVVVNCVGETDCSGIDAAIKGANEILGDNATLVKKKEQPIEIGEGEANDNKLGDADDKEVYDRAKEELGKQKELQNKDGKWNGKGIKIYVADDCWTEKPTTAGWAWHYRNVICIEAGHPNINRNLAHEAGHNLSLKDTYDPNDKDHLMYGYIDGGNVIPPEEEEEMAKRGAVIGSEVEAEVKNISPGSGATSKTPKKVTYPEGGVSDDLHDIYADPADPCYPGSGMADPCDPNFAYIDIDSIGMAGSEISVQGGRTLIYLSLNGVFPGTPSNPYRPGVPDRSFEVEYSIKTVADSNSTIVMSVSGDGMGGLYTQAWYEDDFGRTYYSENPIILINEIHLSGPEGSFDPSEKIFFNHLLEFSVPTSDLLKSGMQPFEGVDLFVESEANDSWHPSHPITDSMGNFTFAVGNPDSYPGMYFIGPSPDPGGLGFGVGGCCMEANSYVQIELDGTFLGTVGTDGFGAFLYFDQSGVPLETDRLYEVTIADTNGQMYPGFFYYSDGPDCPEGHFNGDLDNDCDVDLDDFVILAHDWLKGTI